jgi:hypothetical protein
VTIGGSISDEHARGALKHICDPSHPHEGGSKFVYGLGAESVLINRTLAHSPTKQSSSAHRSIPPGLLI